MLNQGLSLLREGKLREAERAFRAELQRNPRSAQALHGMAIIAHRAGQFQHALEWFDQVILIEPQFAAAFVNRGNTLAAMNRHIDAVDSFLRALEASPGLPSGLINMATALHALGRLDEAVHALEQARLVQPGSAELLNNLGNMVKDQGRLAYAQSCYEMALQINPMLQQAFSNKLAAAKVDASLGPEDLLTLAREWAGWFEAVSGNAPLLTNSAEPSRCLKIGYVSPDCHLALPAFLDPVISAHDRTRFQVFGYFNHPQQAGKMAELGLAATARSMLGMSDQQVARLIHADGIDILIDIAGHTGHNRLGVFACCPAPVQITWLDYLCTTGLSGMNYRITDCVADPAGSEAFHSESLLRFAPGQSQWCWRPDSAAPPVAALPASASGAVTFGSFNNAQKLTDATLALWSRLMQAIPDARLRLAGIPTGLARQRVLTGLDCDASRVDFLPRMNLPDYRNSFAGVDIALDPMPFSGATTTLDALWQGVPVLTLPGATSCSRSSASLLTVLGLEEWIAVEAQDFVARARRVSADLPMLAALRVTLRERLQASTVLNTRQFTRDLECLYLQAWREWCAAVERASETPATMAGAQMALIEARNHLAGGQLEPAVDALTRILMHRPHWVLAKQELVRACLPWARAHPEAVAAWHRPVLQPPERLRISAVICSIHGDYFGKISRQLSQQFAAHEFEIIGIHDAKSLCEGYNRGAEQAAGDFLIFCHDDIEIVHADFGERLLHHLRRHDLIGVVGTSKLVSGNWEHAGQPFLHGQIVHRPAPANGLLYFAAGLQQSLVENVQALDGVFMATHRKVWEALRFDARTFDGFHLYDIDFSYRAHLAGYRLAIPMDLLLIHFSTGKFDLKWQLYHQRFLTKFPVLSNRPNPLRNMAIQVKLPSFEQIESVHSALLHLKFGAGSR